MRSPTEIAEKIVALDKQKDDLIGELLDACAGEERPTEEAVRVLRAAREAAKVETP